MSAFPVHLERVRELSHNKRVAQRDRSALLALLAMFGRLRHVLIRYLHTDPEGQTPELGGVDLEATQLLAEIEGRSFNGEVPRGGA